MQCPMEWAKPARFDAVVAWCFDRAVLPVIVLTLLAWAAMFAAPSVLVWWMR